MKRRALLLLSCSNLLLVATSADAGEVRIELLDKRTNETTVYSLDTRTLAESDAKGVSGDRSRVATGTTYTIVDRRLTRGGKSVADANEILFQGEVDGDDLVVIRSEFNSMAGPLDFLSSCGGHPAQVSKIIVLRLRGGDLATRRELVRKPSSYHWAVDVSR